MNKQELINYLYELEKQLQSKEVEDKFIGKARFTRYRSQLGKFVGELENTQLAEIAQKLNTLSDEFAQGKREVAEELKKLRDLEAVLNTLGKVLSLLAKLLGMATTFL